MSVVLRIENGRMDGVSTGTNEVHRLVQNCHASRVMEINDKGEISAGWWYAEAPRIWVCEK